MKRVWIVTMALIMVLGAMGCGTKITEVKSEVQMNDLISALNDEDIGFLYDLHETEGGYTFEKQPAETFETALFDFDASGTMDEEQNIEYIKFINTHVKYGSYFSSEQKALALVEKIVANPSELNIADLKAAYCLSETMALLQVCNGMDDGEELSTGLEILVSDAPIVIDNWTYQVSSNSDESGTIIIEATFAG